MLRPEIKNMPAYDPDAEINGLSLTIPVWTGSLSRASEKIPLEIVSPGARERLHKALTDLADQVRRLVCMIER